jgi:pimeloyl-ACP methyl ester carboxylesterase
MAEYVELDGMRMWYDKHGAGEALVMLHPGGVDSRAYGPNLQDFASRFTVFLPEQRGHGHTPDVNGEFMYELMADDTIKFIEQVVGGPTLLMGMSDGGVVALLVALRRPDLVRRLVFVAAVFHHEGWDEGVLQPGAAPPEFMAEGYGKVSPDGKAHYAVIAKKLDAMHASGPTLAVDDLRTIRCRTLAMFGDDDEVRLEHYCILPQHAQLRAGDHSRHFTRAARREAEALRSDHDRFPDERSRAHHGAASSCRWSCGICRRMTGAAAHSEILLGRLSRLFATCDPEPAFAICRRESHLRRLGDGAGEVLPNRTIGWIQHDWMSARHFDHGPEYGRDHGTIVGHR